MLIDNLVSIILDPTSCKQSRRFLETSVIWTISQESVGLLITCLLVQGQVAIWWTEHFLFLRHARELLWTPKQRFIGVLPLHFIFPFFSFPLRETASSRALYGGHWGSGTKNPVPGQTKARVACHHKLVKSMKGMFNVVVERWGQMLFTVFIFHVKSVFLFFQLLLGVKDIFLPYLAFFSVKKVTENFHCNKHFFLYSCHWGIITLQVQNWGVEGLAGLFLATYLFMKESKPTFLCIAAGLWPLSDSECLQCSSLYGHSWSCHTSLTHLTGRFWQEFFENLT